MKPRTWATVAALLLAAALPALTARGAELSAKELKKLDKQAGKAFAAGQLSEAAELYRQLLAATSPGDERRADALYAVAMIHLAPDAGPRDPAAARPLLDELAASFPRHPQRLEIAAAGAALDELRAARGAIERAAAELAETRAALAAERQQIASERQEIAGESEAAGGQVRSLEAQLRKMRSELAETQSELAKKEDALQKLKSALVGRAGGGR